MLKFQYAAVVILIIIVIIAYCMHCERACYKVYISGMWSGEPTFLDKANLSDFQFYISKDQKSGYLIIADVNGDFIANQTISINIAYPWLSSSPFKKIYKANIQIKGLPDDADDIPSNMTMSVSMQSGTMVLHNTKTKKIYAFLTKDHAATLVAQNLN